MKRRTASNPARTAMKLLCLLLGVILAVMLSATAYFQPMRTSLGLRSGPDPAQAVGKLLSAVSVGSGNVNILLIGNDGREGEAGARSDSMILCTFDRRAKTLVMTSFLRDLYVPIPGYGSNRLNAAYAFGGRELLKKTLEENFDIRIDGSVEVDFSHFAQIVDMLGGVTLELRQDEADTVNQETGSSLSAGTQTLNGDQALAYSRIRRLDADGDFSRTARQRKVLSAFLNAYREASLGDMLSTAARVLPMLDTDLNSVEIIQYTTRLLPILSGGTVTSQHIPTADGYYDQTIDGMSVLIADMEKARRMLR